MKVNYIVQPDEQFGKVLSTIGECNPTRIVFISAFVDIQSIIRIREDMLSLKERGTKIRFVLGIDLGGTSEEVLQELLTWGIEVLIVKNRIPGHTFHPKLYIFEWEKKSEIIVGSNNMTEGGFYKNYECAAHIGYELPQDSSELENALVVLGRFIDPKGEIVQRLTQKFLNKLIERHEVPTEEDVRKSRKMNPLFKTGKRRSGEEHTFGTEDINPPPPLPAELLKKLVQHVNLQRKQRKSKVKTPKTTPPLPSEDETDDLLTPSGFYMTLPTLQGPSIPGEARIPLEAVELAYDFWGWPYEYTQDISPRGGGNRVYWNWRPQWRVWSVETPKNKVTQVVRMYMYENSSDFRFYARPLVDAGADLGDVIRIRRIAETNAEFECILARRGTPEYDKWIKYCTQNVRNSTRKFGYA